MTTAHREAAGATAWLLRIFGVVLALIGVALLIGGVQLAALGGSWYYLLAGAGLLVSGGLIAVRRGAGAWLFAVVTVLTVVWAVAEAGFRFWPLMPRLAPFAVLAFVLALLLPALFGPAAKRASGVLAGLLGLVLVAGAASVFQEHGTTDAKVQPQNDAVAIEANGNKAPWQYYGRTPAGTRFAPFDQINVGNAKELQVAWTYRTGEMATGASELQNTPTQIGDTVYVCTPRNKVIALDAETGQEKWVFDPKVEDRKTWNRCRGVGYYEPAAVAQPYALDEDQAFHANQRAKPGTPGVCTGRIVLTTLDARLIQIDAQTGKPCTDFGHNGEISLTQGLGKTDYDGVLWWYLTSAPTVVNNMIVLGGWVFDGRGVDEPSGVVRAFSADSGELVWAWDMGQPEITKLPPEGGQYSRATPNVWSTPAFDEKLGLIYMPTGNQQPDFWGGNRPETTEKHSSAVVALDIRTGRPQWVFQTVHHDIWDYDLASQPALYDVPDGKGGKIPALIQLTKRGQIFMLDRRNGEPIADVVEKPVPLDVAKGDWVAKTQPYSTGMPSFGAEPLTEARMWGATFFDQLACRIQFRKLKYEGEFTAPAEVASLLYPGYYGGFNWGSASIDERNGYLFLNDIRMPQIVQLEARETVDPSKLVAGHGVGSTYPMTGTPFVIDHRAFNSPLGIPCNEPPWGVFAAVDLKTRQLVWERPAGTVEDAVINGIKARLPVPLGMPTLGGGVTTAGGLAFYAGTQDYYLRAIDTATGKDVWKGRLPVGGQATPMTYISPASGRQFVVIAAGGARQSPDRGDYVVAYALPKKP